MVIITVTTRKDLNFCTKFLAFSIKSAKEIKAFQLKTCKQLKQQRIAELREETLCRPEKSGHQSKRAGLRLLQHTQLTDHLIRLPYTPESVKRTLK
jgi:hypothetical protein